MNPGTTTKNLRGAAAQRAAPRATAWALFTTIKYLRRARRRERRPGYHDQVPATQNESRRGKRPGHQDHLPAAHCSPAVASRRAKYDHGSSHDDAQPDNPTLYTVAFRLHTGFVECPYRLAQTIQIAQD